MSGQRPDRMSFDRAGARGHSFACYAVVAAFMSVHIASSVFGAAGPDTTRDVAAALLIRDHAAFPMHGPLLAGAWHLGPIWFYLLALPLIVCRSWTAVALFVALLSSLQFALAFAAGRRLLDARLGLLWCALLALPGWGSFQLVGFSHTNMVATCTLLTLYALVRLVQDRQPWWLVVAGIAFGLALHAHPTTAWLAVLIVPTAVYALRKPATIVRWGSAAAAMVALPLLPLAVEHFALPANETAPIATYIRDTLPAANLANLPALLWGILVRGPQVIGDAFFGAWPWIAAVAGVAILAIELAALCGLAPAALRQRRLVAISVGATVGCALLVAWIRPATPFYFSYALLPPLAGLGALGLWGLCAAAAGRGRPLLAIFVGLSFSLHALTAFAIARAIESGSVTLGVTSRLDIKRDDATPALPEPWLPAYAVDDGARWLCSQRAPVILHATFAFLDEMYVGLPQRLHCPQVDMRLLGTQPNDVTHVVGLPRAAWRALGWQPSQFLGGIGVSSSVRALWPAAGLSPSDGSVYPPTIIGSSAPTDSVIDVRLSPGDALVVSQPYIPWMASPGIQVTANGVAQTPRFRDVVSTVYACGDCAGGASIAWHIGLRSSAPERIDIVALPAPGSR